jgi:hypothetical protein
MATGTWVILINAVDPQGQIIEHPAPGMAGQLFLIFEYYPAGRPTVFTGEAFGFLFELPTPNGRISPVHTGHQPSRIDDPLHAATFIGGCVNPSLPFSEQQFWTQLLHPLLDHFRTHSPSIVWTVDPALHLSNIDGQWTWQRIGHADDTSDPWDRPTYRFDGYTSHTPSPSSQRLD